MCLASQIKTTLSLWPVFNVCCIYGPFSLGFLIVYLEERFEIWHTDSEGP